VLHCATPILDNFSQKEIEIQECSYLGARAFDKRVGDTILSVVPKRKRAFLRMRSKDTINLNGICDNASGRGLNSLNRSKTLRPQFGTTPIQDIVVST
jgi:hypothetical protein